MKQFRSRWLWANALAFLSGYLVYTPLAHGFTGAHSRDLTAPQFFAHCIALALLGVLVAVAQRWALTPLLDVPRSRLGVTALAFPVAFWIGYYQPWINGPDSDMLLGFMALGTATWAFLPPLAGRWKTTLLAAVSFALAGFVGQLGLFGAIIGLGWSPDFQGNALHHGIFWVSIGVSAGVLGGYLSARLLASALAND